MGDNFPSGAAARHSALYSPLAGYDDQQPLNSHSHQQEAQQQQQRPDLYADFNGIGPRYAARLSSSADMYASSGGSNTPLPELGYNSSPQHAETQTSLLSGKRQSMAAGELMDAPELGKDWNGEESRKSRVLVEKPGFATKSSTAMINLRKKARKAFAWKRLIFVFVGFLIWCVSHPCRFQLLGLNLAGNLVAAIGLFEQPRHSPVLPDPARTVFPAQCRRPSDRPEWRECQL